MTRVHSCVVFRLDEIALLPIAWAALVLGSLQAKLLVSASAYAYCATHPELVDFISIQIWTSDLFTAMKEVRAKHPQKPIFNIEHGGYEAGPYHVFTGDHLSADACLERAYQCVFAGTFPTHYWQDTSWSVVIHNPDALPANHKPKLHYGTSLTIYPGRRIVFL